LLSRSYVYVVFIVVQLEGQHAVDCGC